MDWFAGMMCRLLQACRSLSHHPNKDTAVLLHCSNTERGKKIPYPFVYKLYGEKATATMFESHCYQTKLFELSTWCKMITILASKD